MQGAHPGAHQSSDLRKNVFFVLLNCVKSSCRPFPSANVSDFGHTNGQHIDFVMWDSLLGSVVLKSELYGQLQSPKRPQQIRCVFYDFEAVQKQKSCKHGENFTLQMHVRLTGQVLIAK